LFFRKVPCSDGARSSPELISAAVWFRLETLRLQRRHDLVAMVRVTRFQGEDHLDFAHPYRGPGTTVLDSQQVEPDFA
jgi:hypothetical protein